MTPKFIELYKIQGNWKQIVEKVMEFPENMTELIVSNWENNIEIAKNNNTILEPQKYAEMFVDENYI
jgi:hypothetical protein